jgi:hypothetical protein
MYVDYLGSKNSPPVAAGAVAAAVAVVVAVAVAVAGAEAAAVVAVGSSVMLISSASCLAIRFVG